MLHSLFLIGSFGTTEILLIVFVIILLFGAKRIPELFKGMGQGVREFKDAQNQSQGQNQPPQYRDQPPVAQPPYAQPGTPQAGYPQPGAAQPGYPAQGYQQAPPVFNPNDPATQPRQ